MNSQQIKERFVALGREDALSANPVVTMTDELLWRRAKSVVSARLRHEEIDDQGWFAARAQARGGYVEGWNSSHQLMITVPHLRIVSQVWTLGYRNTDDCRRLNRFLDEGDEQAACRLLVDIRYRPLWPYHPQWSRKQLQARYCHRYRYLHALGNTHYDSSDLPIELVDEQAGLTCLVGWLQAGWDLILLCACADAATCHRRLVAERLQQWVKDDPRIQVHLPEEADA